MEVSNQPKLRFQGVDIVRINFDIVQQYDNKTSIDFNVEPKVFYPNDDSLFFKILMDVSLKCEGFFELSLVGIGNYELDKDFNDENLKKTFVNSNAPAIMFPYIRSFVSSLTSQMGNATGNITIPTQFFHGELSEIQDTQELDE